jgi:hypothetical protein
MNKIIAAFAVVAFMLVCPSMWPRLAGPRPFVNPSTYSSPSGEFSLFVDPTDRLGRGPAEYRFIKRGAVSWAKQLPFTLHNAVVADSGHVIGYAYTNGLEGRPAAGDGAGYGEFVAVILTEKGESILNETHQRDGSRFEDGVPNPAAEGIIIDGQGKRAIFRIPDPDLNRGIEKWWIYDPDNGKHLETIAPEKPIGSYNRIFSIKAVPGTPFVLTQWSNYAAAMPGAIFTLVDPIGKSIWDVNVYYSYSSQGNSTNEIMRIIAGNGAITDRRKPGIFNLPFAADKLRISYAVVKQPSGKWEVKKTGQSPLVPYTLNRPAPLPAFRAINLEKLGAAGLSAGFDQKASSIHNIISFEFDAKGNICALRGGTSPALLYLSQDGDVLKELQLPIRNLSEEFRYSNPANVGDNLFVVSASTPAIGAAAQWFLADFQAGVIDKIDSDVCPFVNQAAGFPDGRFAALTTRNEKYTMTPGLFFFDPNGKIIWKKERGDYSSRSNDLFSPSDIITYKTDCIAVLDKIRHTIQIFDTKGSFIRSINLNDAWGRKPNYPTHLAQDRNGGFLVYDFNAPKTFVQIDEHGAILNESTPALADGIPLYVHRVIRSPQGDLWINNVNALFRLGPDSKVVFALGQSPQKSILSMPGRVETGPDNRIYIADRRTKTIHVFDSSGASTGRYSPNAEDLKETSEVEHIAITHEGAMYVSLGSSTRYLRFLNNGTREGWAPHIDVDRIKQKWYFQPSSGLCWILGYNDVFLMRNLENVIKKISRRPDGRWLEYPDSGAVAADGSLAVLAHTQSGTSGTYSITTYSSSGEPQKTFDLPFSLFSVHRLAYDGKWVVILVKNDVFVYGLDGKSVGKFSLPPLEENDEWDGPWLAKQEKELWFIERKELQLHRYAVPKNFKGDKQRIDQKKTAKN